MTLQRRPTSPFGELMSLRSQMDRLFEDAPGFGRRGWPFEGALHQMPIDISSTEGELVIQASLPGVKPEDVEITVDGSLLTIRGESRSERNEQEQGSVLNEIRWGSVSRSFTLPEGLEADKSQADFTDGILTLRVPKTEQVKPRQIRIQPTGQPKQVGVGTGTGVGQGSATGDQGDRDASRGSIG